MAVHFLKTDNGIFSYINSTTIFNYIKNNYGNYTDLYNNGSPTAALTNFKNNCSEIRNCIFTLISRPRLNWNVDLANAFLDCFPISILNKNWITGIRAIEGNQNGYITMSDASADCQWRLLTNSSGVVLNNGAGYTGGYYLAAWRYGGSDSDITQVSGSLLVFNDNYTSARTLGISAYKYRSDINIQLVSNNNCRPEPTDDQSFYTWFANAIPYHVKIDINNATVTLNPSSYVYTGQACEPTVTVTYNGTQLTENTDYTKTYINNINIGTASVQIAGIGDYEGTKTVNFTIGAPNIADATMLITPSNYWYNGQACEPTVSVIYNGTQLTENVEYTKTYTNNINPGTATVTIAGISPYIGTQSLTFTIEKRSTTQANITLYPAEFVYDGQPKTPTVTVICDDHQLTENTDYTLTYTDNVNVGTANVTVTATQNTYWITGYATIPFRIFTSGGNDPYSPGGDTEPDIGGNGDFTTTSDTIVEPPAPTVSVVDAGFCRLYNPTLSQLKNLAQYMWTDTTFLQTVINHAKQLFENPMEAIISLNLLPCSIDSGTSEEVKVMFVPTGVYMNPVTNQYPIVNCGDVLVEKRYDSALDYSPYTEVSCFLPFIGTVTFDTDEVMGNYIAIKYHIDVATGVCVAFVTVNGSVLYQYSGHCAMAQPFSSADFMTYVGAALQASKMVGGVIAAGTGHPAVAAELVGGPRFSPERTTQRTTDITQQGNPSVHMAETTTIPAHGMSFGELTRQAIDNSVSAVMGSKAKIQHTGGFSGASGFLGERRPYLIIKRPRIANPNNYSKYNGRPSMQYMQLSACHGYTEVQSIQLTDIPATNIELSEISELLKSGVIL